MERQYVGIDLHRRRSVIVRRTKAGATIETVRIDNDPLALAAELAKAGPPSSLATGPPWSRSAAVARRRRDSGATTPDAAGYLPRTAPRPSFGGDRAQAWAWASSPVPDTTHPEGVPLNL